MISRLLTAEAVLGVQAISAGAAAGVAQVAIDGAHVSPWVIYAAVLGAVAGGMITARDAFDRDNQRPVAIIALFAGVSTFLGATCGIFMSEFFASVVEWLSGRSLAGAQAFGAVFIAVTAEQFVGGVLKSFLNRIGGGNA